MIEPAPATSALAATWEKLPRFVRNVLVSLPTFLFDLVLMIVLVRWLRMDYLAATVLAFVVTNAVSYVLARKLVFAGSRRSLSAGFVYFTLIAGLCLAALTPLMWLLVAVLHVDFVVSRVLAGVIIGVGGYLANRLLNFRQGLPEVWPGRARGKEPREAE